MRTLGRACGPGGAAPKTLAETARPGTGADVVARRKQAPSSACCGAKTWSCSHCELA